MFLKQILSLLITFGPLTYGFVLLSSSSVAAGTGNPTARDNVFHLGKSWTYTLETTVLLNNVNQSEKNVGFQIESDIIVSSIWESPENVHKKLLKIEVVKPKLYIKSRKAPAPEGFIYHSSKLDSLPNYPFYISWNGGIVNKIFYDKREQLSLINLKKGISSLFQFQLLDGNSEETDASGQCSIIYSSIGPHSFSKTKVQCTKPNDLPYLKHSNQLLSSTLQSQRQANYELNVDNNVIERITTQELHDFNVIVRNDAGCNIHTIQQLRKTSDGTASKIQANNIQSVLQKLESSIGSKLIDDVLLTKREIQQPTLSLAKLIKENKEWLKDDKLGSIKSANAFVKVLSGVREANRQDVIKVLKHSRNKDILLQLYDIVGFAQTEEAHEAAKSVLNFDDENDFDCVERYLGALSMCSHLSSNVLQDILKLSKKEFQNPKLVETILLTLGAMAHQYENNNVNKGKLNIVNKIEESLLNGLDFCKEEENCLLNHLRALQNLKHASTVPHLIKYARNGSRKVNVAAMKALRMLPNSAWNAEVLDTCHKIFYMYGKPYDSSARTLALDIILESKPDQTVLTELINFLLSNDRAFEVKQYLIQQLRVMSESDNEFREVILNIIRSNPKINNYAVLSQKGLSTAFSRSFVNNPSVNGSLVTVQEIHGGILKRGIVDVVLENNGVKQEMFRLGLFAGGLGSFVSSDNNNEVDPASDPDESANAGMELAVMGVQLRPFVFFSGQGELMGHVWSGTASEKTPAYQALILLQDHLEYLRLGVGMIAELQNIGGTSFDLSGHIQISLWNRNAQSWVEKTAGILLTGLVRIDTSFVNSKIEYSLSIEPKLNLVSDIEFYSGVSLCMQLKQPDTVLRHNIYKIERIPGSKHKLRKSTYKVIKVPGKTYALNQKNNEMCNVIFKDK